MKKDLPIPRTDSKTKHLDLEGGIRLTEDVRESESGTAWVRYSRISCSGETVLSILWDNRTAGRTYCSQGYWRNGKLVLSDGDEDGDGIFDQLVLWNDAGGPIQVLQKTRDGRLVPMAKARLQEMQKEHIFMRDIMTPVMEGAKRGMSQEEFRRVIEDAIEKAKKGLPVPRQEQVTKPEAGESGTKPQAD